MSEQKNSVKPKKNHCFAIIRPQLDSDNTNILRIKTFQILQELKYSKKLPINDEEDLKSVDKLNSLLNWVIINLKTVDPLAHTLLNNTIALGANVNNKLDNKEISSEFLGYSPLHIACALEKDLFARALLAKSANPNLLINDQQHRIFGLSPMGIALHTRNYVLATQLLFFKGNSFNLMNLKYLRSPDHELDTVLKESVLEGINIAFFKLLASKNQNIINYFGQTRLKQLHDLYLYFMDFDKANFIEAILKTFNNNNDPRVKSTN